VNEAMIEVHVEGAPGAVPARAFLEVLRTSLDILDQLERAERPLAKTSGQWLVAELRNDSATATLWRPDAPSPHAPLWLVDGVGQLRRTEGLPQYFSPEIAAGLIKIGRQVRRDGVGGVRFLVPATEETPARAEEVSSTVVSNALASVEGTEHALGSVAGLLDVINLRRGAHQVSLYDDETRRAVRCRFPEVLFEVIKDALGHRVRILGEVTRNRQGQILRMDTDRLERLADTPPAPSVDDLAGIAPWYTGDQSTDEYLRAVRGA
jgi:hypothetical protein